MSKDKEYQIIIEERSTFVVRCGGDTKTDAVEHALYLADEYKKGNLNETNAPIQALRSHKVKAVRIK